MGHKDPQSEGEERRASQLSDRRADAILIKRAEEAEAEVTSLRAGMLSAGRLQAALSERAEKAERERDAVKRQNEEGAKWAMDMVKDYREKANAAERAAAASVARVAWMTKARDYWRELNHQNVVVGVNTAAQVERLREACRAALNDPPPVCLRPGVVAMLAAALSEQPPTTPALSSTAEFNAQWVKEVSEAANEVFNLLDGCCHWETVCAAIRALGEQPGEPRDMVAEANAPFVVSDEPVEEAKATPAPLPDPDRGKVVRDALVPKDEVDSWIKWENCEDLYRERCNMVYDAVAAAIRKAKGEQHGDV